MKLSSSKKNIQNIHFLFKMQFYVFVLKWRNII